MNGNNLEPSVPRQARTPSNSKENIMDIENVTVDKISRLKLFLTELETALESGRKFHVECRNHGGWDKKTDADLRPFSHYRIV